MPTKTEIAISKATTVFGKTVQKAPVVPVKSTGLRVLKPAKTNRKISGGKKGVIAKGPKTFRGKPLFNLTLVERMTCPTDCPQWTVCYGNNMYLAKRYLPGQDLIDALNADLQVLEDKYPLGFVIRLHILGDFYSLDYVHFWGMALYTIPNMSIYGYTHRQHGTPIGDAVTKMVQTFPDRVSILRSDPTGKGDPLPSAHTVHKSQTPDAGIVICPEQTGKSESCLTCGLCFNGRTSVQFLEH